MRFKVVCKPKLDLIKQAFKISNEVYDEIDLQGIQLYNDWGKINKNIYTFIVDKKTLVGEILFIPVTDECYNNFIQGKVKDSNIGTSNLLKFSKDKPNKCIFDSVIINKKYQNSACLRILLKAFLKRIKSLTKKGYTISHIAADCVSKNRQRLAQKIFKMNYICDSINGKIYEKEL